MAIGKMRLLVTGATGFIGQAVVLRAAGDLGCEVRAAGRRPAPNLPARVEEVRVGELAPDTDWRAAVRDVDVVVHAAARVHMMHDSSTDPLSEYRRVNVQGTLRLARQAVDAGVRRLIFISSIKVNGARTRPGQPYLATDAPAPQDPYGVSKHEAELGLREVAEQTGLEVVVVRPVLVYGPGVKAHFQAMMRALHRGVPLPFGSLNNRRSLVAVDNLVDLIQTCAHHVSAANQTFLVSDGEDLSTTALLQRTSAALGRPARLVPVPAQVVRAVAHVLGKGEMAHRLCDDLQVDASATLARLQWSPPVSVHEALQRTARHFLASRSQ